MSIYNPASLRRPIGELERLAEAMILWFKPERLPMPVITVQGGYRQALGWFAWSRWECRDGGILNEINFVPEHLGRDVFDIAETLVHELVHLANYMAGIKDCTSNQYHNAHFRDRALAFGLQCERVALHGWARTSLTSALRGRIAGLHPDSSAFDLFRLPPAPRREVKVDVQSADGKGSVVVQTKRKKLSKWTCLGECASAWVASGTELDADCRRCGGQFHRAET